MNINRDNYETIFLLYIDHELSVAERKAVEEFVAQHPDLYEELMQLQDVVLNPEEPAIFADKESLLRTSLVDDTIEENMLMLLDDELEPSEAKAVNNMIASNPKLQEDWAVLQRTKLEADEKIIFAEKHLLYRREKDNVIAGRFVRWAVAAMLIGAGFFTAMTFINKKNTDKPDVALTTPENKENQLATNSQTDNIGKNNSATTIIDSIDAATPSVRSTPTEEDDTQAEQRKHQQQLADNHQKNIPDEKLLPEIKTVVPQENVLLASNKTNQQIEKISPEKTDLEMAISAAQKKPDLRDINMLDLPNTGIASTASLTEETNDDRILYLNEEDVSRSKAGGFFRKIKRTITRKANIKTGNGLKIAGFEIALK